MATHTGLLIGTDWPSIEDGERTDRGWEHLLQPTWTWTLGIGDDVELRLVVPARESWIVEYVGWEWSAAPAPVWTSALILRELRRGQQRRLLVNPFDWRPMGGTLARDRTLYTIPGTDEEIGEVNRSQMETDVCALRGEARWGFNWVNETTGGVFILGLWLLVVRIPLAKERHWDKKDMANALTQIEGLGRRVS